MITLALSVPEMVDNVANQCPTGLSCHCHCSLNDAQELRNPTSGRFKWITPQLALVKIHYIFSLSGT